MTKNKKRTIKQRFAQTVLAVGILWCLLISVSAAESSIKTYYYEIHVHAGLIADSIEYLKARKFWNATSHQKTLDVPRIIIVTTSQNWRKESKSVPVEVKKELFYRSILPMVLFSNELIMDERLELEAINSKLNTDKKLTSEEQATLQSIAEKYGMEDKKNTQKQIAGLLERVDIIPPSLALGQTAYESGYGTSRFAVEGNALFGQWTYSGNGMKPKEHRASKGNYGVAAYRWPFDSVRSYMQNLNTHNAYQGLRDKRAALRKQGKDLTGMALSEALGSYSEKGMEYVKTLQSIIRVNKLAVADNAHLRDEPVTLIVGVDSKEEIKETEAKIEEFRASGKLDKILREMRLQSVKRSTWVPREL